ncbi:hypothetical protein H4R18_000662 [Coemansia javaensis]|uniref:Uncharacterized protein n=1 Tax=Coemansia javaensis TaxID=2761396 RepID=A0A9W8LMH1_9FUNG|nr:hypothetical protein H4R18_000662 [Coemansia javaensis]
MRHTLAGHARHKEFSERFMDILRNAKVEPPKPGVADIGAAEADARLAEELRALFRKSPVTVTPELLEQRRRLRSEYPELFKDISDKDLDG